VVSDTPSPFSDVPRTARAHLGLRFYEAAFAVLRHLRARAESAGKGVEVVMAEFPRLAGYLAELDRRFPPCEDWAERAVQVHRAIVRWEEADPGAWLPLRGLEQAGLSTSTVAALVFAGLAEEEAGFGEVFAAIQRNGASRPSLGLLRALLFGTGIGESADPWELGEPLLSHGLAVVHDRDAPRAEWILRVPSPVWAALRGERLPEPAPGLRHLPVEELEGADHAVLPATVAARLPELVGMVTAGWSGCLAVRGTPATDRLGVAGAVAHARGCGLLRVGLGAGSEERLRLVGPLATLLRAMPVFEPELGPTETFVVPTLGRYRGPVAVLLGMEGGLAGAERTIAVTLPFDPPEVRQRRWERELGARGTPHAGAIARSCTVSGGLIREYARLAIVSADLGSRQEVTPEDVRQAARTLNRQQLDSLAARLEDAGGWDGLIVPEALLQELRELERRCREREALVGAVGREFPGGFNRGVRVLFEGASGTGKTLAARALAGELGMDLYRMDLAAVVNKYIGETEKNLSRVLERAEDLDVILLLDEGDALLTKRTDVRSANDRYANLETNYLLQRLETYQGIVIVTTNLGGQIDTAFRRRMDVAVKFQLPEPADRWQIWALHLPAGHQVASGALDEIAERYVLTGAQIRNAVVYAGLLALGARRPVGQDDVLAGIEVEHRKAGASLPSRAGVAPVDTGRALRSFLELIS
jgi:hypothetical protein